MEHNQTLPKLLPWLAKRAGIDQDRAATLWWQAERYALDYAGTNNTSAYWQLAMEQFRSLLGHESLQMDVASLGIRPLTRNHEKWVRAVIEACNRASCRLRYWQRLSLQILPIATGSGRR